MTESMEIEDKSDRNESPEQNKLGILCKSIAASNVSEEFSSSEQIEGMRIHETRWRRIK